MNTPRPHGDGADLTRAVAELAEALTALRRASGMSLEKFATTVNLSPPQLMLVENGHAVPDYTIFTSYLEFAAPAQAERHRLRGLWKVALRLAEEHGSASSHGAFDTIDHVLTQLERRPSRAGETVRYASGTRPSSSPDLTQDITLSLTKPSWRRSVAKSQADPKLWPDPSTITTVEEFTAALLAIKSSTGLSYEALAAASRRASYPLARSTVHSLCTKKKLPGSPTAVACFIEICGGSREDVLNWSTTWQRLVQQAAVDELAVPDPHDENHDKDRSRPYVITAADPDGDDQWDASKSTPELLTATDATKLVADEIAVSSSRRMLFMSMLVLLALAVGFTAGAILF